MPSVSWWTGYAQAPVGEGLCYGSMRRLANAYADYMRPSAVNGRLGEGTASEASLRL